MKAPWPKLRTSIRPKTSVSPDAMMKMIMPMASPAKVSVTQVEKSPTSGHDASATTGTSSTGAMSRRRAAIGELDAADGAHWWLARLKPKSRCCRS